MSNYELTLPVIVCIEERNKRLLACDWTMLPDCVLSEEKVNEWKVYRQSLRDIHEHENFPALFAEDWPKPPES